MGTTFSFSLPADENGFIGRECPVCSRYFKIKPGTGLPHATNCYCAYCGKTGENTDFYTKDQIEFAKSLALREVHRQLGEAFQGIRTASERQDGFLRLTISFKEGSPPGLFRYREQDLESQTVCDECALEYTVYGVFAFCPDCGAHNSLQIFGKSMDTIEKMLELSSKQSAEIRTYLVQDALENVVSAFDGFGRECIRMVLRSRGISSEPCSFQNLERAAEWLHRELKVDFKSLVNSNEWQCLVNTFGKRHLLAHSMGVVDERYLRSTNDNAAIVGHKVRIDATEVQRSIELLRRLASGLSIAAGS